MKTEPQAHAAKPIGPAGRIAAAFLDSKLTPLLVIGAILVGVFAVAVTPREEEPQIQVPMIDIFAGLPGATAEEVEQRITAPIETAVSEIDGVEYVYSTSQPSGSLTIVRFLVGTDPDDAVLRVQAKMAETASRLPADAPTPRVEARSIDDVPILAYTLHSSTLTPLELRRLALEVRHALSTHAEVAEVTLIGGGRRVVRIDVDPRALASRGLTLLQLRQSLVAAGQRLPAGSLVTADHELEVLTDGAFRSADDVAGTVVAVPNGSPVYLRDVATVRDAAEDPDTYVFMMGGAAASERGLRSDLDAPAVTVAVAKKPGTNAVELVHALDARMDGLQKSLIPQGVTITKTRDYGATADEKASELIEHLWGATLSVILLMALVLGRREALVVALVVPTTLALTLASSYLFGYTLNRVTLFALIFAIGILVDDAIVVVENIHRHYLMGREAPREAAIRATDEVGNPTILATFTIISALLPLAFVSGLMGPYMQPIPINASAAMLFSLAVAFIVSPWLTHHLFRRHAAELAEEARASRERGEELDLVAGTRSYRFYRRLIKPLLDSRWKRWAMLAFVAGLLFASFGLVGLRAVKMKMLPYDNKSELQVVLDMPEGTTLEATASLARRLASEAARMPEVTDIQVYAGTSAPFNFNGLVRHYFLRAGSNVADLQVNLRHKEHRQRASHPFAKALRERLQPLVEGTGARLKVTEVPPGPPVLSTLVAEIYGPDLETRLRLAQQVEKIFEDTDGVVDIDAYIEDAAPRIDFTVDRAKAALVGATPQHIAHTLHLALTGGEAGLLQTPSSREPVPLRLRLDRASRASLADLEALAVPGDSGPVALAELARPVHTERERFRYRKNMQPVTYVVAEVAGGAESPVYAMLAMGDAVAALEDPLGRKIQVLSSTLPEDPTAYAVKWDGEWQITYEVFRDMGIAFAIVLVLIYVLVVGWFGDFMTPLIIMLPIPLTLVGILPAHALGGIFFTATSMIGFIALAGIIVRNSILLVDFIDQELGECTPLEDAVIRAAVVRFRPIALTGATLVVGGSVMLLDPIFQGLAVALISGVVMSTALTLVVIPVIYFMAKTTAQAPELTSTPEPTEDPT